MQVFAHPLIAEGTRRPCAISLTDAEGADFGCYPFDPDALTVCQAKAAAAKAAGIPAGVEVIALRAGRYPVDIVVANVAGVPALENGTN